VHCFAPAHDAVLFSPCYFFARQPVTLRDFLNLIDSNIIKEEDGEVFNALCYLYNFESDDVAAGRRV